MRVIFHGEGDLTKGTGHLVRSLGMAYDLQKSTSLKIETYNNNSVLDQHIRDEWSRYSVEVPKRLLDGQSARNTDPSRASTSWQDDAHETLKKLVSLPRQVTNEVLLTDGKFPWGPQDWSKLKDRFEVVVAVDNLAAKGSSVDAVLFPIDFFDQLGVDFGSLPVLSGPQWMWLHPALDQFQVNAAKAFDISILMGGADPNGLTLMAMKDLATKLPNGGKVLVLYGPSFQRQAEIRRLAQAMPNFDWEIRQAQPGFHQDLLNSKLTLCAFGLVAMEMDQLGHPAVLYHHIPAHLSELEGFLRARARSSVSRETWMRQDLQPKTGTRRSRPNLGLALKRFLEQSR